MALRIEQHVARGEIDNRERGRVRGRIWFGGRDQPVVLELKGNCRRDLAGCLTTFINSELVAAGEGEIEMHPSQKGVTGDMTASRKVRVLDVPLEEAKQIAAKGKPIPDHLANALYLEWFSDANGRVVIESAGFRVEISTPAWEMTPEEEPAQIAATHQALRDWLERLDEIDEPPPDSSFDPPNEEPLDEFGHEKLMRESDARTDRYMQLLAKYEHHPDRERIVAREMGWEWLEEALEADERGALPPREKIDLPPLEPNPATEGIDWVRSEGGDIHHPLTKRVSASAMEMWHFCDERHLLGESGDPDLHEMIFQLQITGAKIAGALDSLAYDDGWRDGGFIVAALKRTLNYLHQSMAATDRVAPKAIVLPERLEAFRAELFEVREEILRLM